MNKTKIILLAAMAFASAAASFAQMSPAWAAAIATPISLARADAMDAIAAVEGISRQKNEAHEVRVRATYRTAGKAAALAVPVPTKTTATQAFVEYYVADEESDYATAEAACRTILTNPQVVNLGAWITRFTAVALKRGSDRNALLISLAGMSGNAAADAKAIWRGLDRSRMTKEQIIDVIDKLTIVTDVTPETSVFLSTIQSTRALLLK